MKPYFHLSRTVVTWPMLIGFYFSFRISLTFLWFQSNPVVGSATTIAIGMLLLTGTIFWSIEGMPSGVARTKIPTTMKWAAAFLGFAVISLIWSATQSRIAALGYWTSLSTDVVMVWLAGSHPKNYSALREILKGFVVGSCLVAAIAWFSPATADLRLGDEDFMHPNVLGWEFALATLFAQYLSRERYAWKWTALAIAITLVRTLSKTSIIAFAIAETFYVLHDAKMSRRARIYTALVATVIIGSFWGLLQGYVDLYANEGSSPETLTGRTAIWAVTLSMALERPWFGHGLYSFRAIIPAFGTFQPWHAHNELLHQFFVYGLMGLTIVCGAYLSLYRQARRALRGDLKSLALAVIIMGLIRGLADTDGVDLSIPLWLLTLISLVLAREATNGHLSQG